MSYCCSKCEYKYSFPLYIGISIETLVRESNNEGSSFWNSSFCSSTWVGCPRIQPSTLTVVVNSFEFVECNATPAPVNSIDPDFFSGSSKDKP